MLNICATLDMEVVMADLCFHGYIDLVKYRRRHNS